nr:TPA_exp: cytochrome P450 enzyme 39 [Aphis glycines]
MLNAYFAKKITLHQLKYGFIELANVNFGVKTNTYKHKAPVRISCYLPKSFELIKLIAIKNFDHFVNHRSFFNPEVEPLFGNNLFSLHDDRWREIRNLLTPAFTSSKMKGMFKLMSNCAENFVDYLVKDSKEKPVEINSKDAFCRYTNDVIATCAFGISINSMEDKNNDFYILGRKSIDFEGNLVTLKFILVEIFPKISKLFNIRIIDSKVDDFFKKIVEDTIRTRDEKGITRPDMIQLMMETRANKTGPTLSIGDMTSQAFIFFLGIQTKLQNEIDEMLEKSNGDPTYEAVNKLAYLDAVINETLRYYPIAGFLDRVCSKSFELPPTLPGKKPLLLKPGDFIWFPVYAIQRDPLYFDDPDKFYPDRFIVDPKGTLNSQAYMPFGLGPRMCIGNRFALLETKVLLVHLIAKCQLKPGKKMIVPLELSKSSFSMAPKGGFWLNIQPRIK